MEMCKIVISMVFKYRLYGKCNEMDFPDGLQRTSVSYFEKIATIHT